MHGAVFWHTGLFHSHGAFFMRLVLYTIIKDMMSDAVFLLLMFTFILHYLPFFHYTHSLKRNVDDQAAIIITAYSSLFA